MIFITEQRSTIAVSMKRANLISDKLDLTNPGRFWHISILGKLVCFIFSFQAIITWLEQYIIWKRPVLSQRHINLVRPTQKGKFESLGISIFWWLYDWCKWYLCCLYYWTNKQHFLFVHFIERCWLALHNEEIVIDLDLFPKLILIFLRFYFT